MEMMVKMAKVAEMGEAEAVEAEAEAVEAEAEAEAEAVEAEAEAWGVARRAGRGKASGAARLQRLHADEQRGVTAQLRRHLLEELLVARLPLEVLPGGWKWKILNFGAA